MNEKIKNFVVETAPSIGNILAVMILFAMAFGGCKTNHCCPQCRANHEYLNVINNDLLELERSVSDMKRGYRTIPVTVCITNAWDYGTKETK